MALYHTLPVYRATYAFVLMLFNLTKEFGREYKYTIGQDLKRDALQLVRHIYRANSNRSSERVEHLERFADDFELIKLELRIAMDLKLISHGQYALAVESMDQIGRQITGWKKSQG